MERDIIDVVTDASGATSRYRIGQSFGQVFGDEDVSAITLTIEAASVEDAERMVRKISASEDPPEISEIVQINATLREQSASAFRALEPFVSAALGPLDVRKGDDGYYWNGIEQGTRITTWFGPSDFGRAIDAFLLLPVPAPENRDGNHAVGVVKARILALIGKAQTEERRRSLQDALLVCEGL